MAFICLACQCGLLLILGTIAAIGGETKSGGFSATQSSEGVLIEEHGRKVLFYQRQSQSQEGRFERANYVHPLYDLTGNVLTEDFPADHPHHRGVFWAWHQLWLGKQKLGDAWSTKDFLARVQSVKVDQPKNGTITLQTKVHWTSSLFTDKMGEPLPIVREQTTITVHPRTKSSRRIDFDIRLAALKPGVKIGGSENAKGYGGFSARLKLTPETRFRGTRGPVAPQINAVDCGPWVDFSTEKSGLAILDHPANPGYPQPWILRRKRSMQNPVYPGRQAVELSQEKPLRLRYRVVVHDGSLEKAAIDQLQQDWAKTASASQ